MISKILLFSPSSSPDFFNLADNVPYQSYHWHGMVCWIDVLLGAELAIDAPITLPGIFRALPRIAGGLGVAS
jgi:hypothetical protein